MKNYLLGVGFLLLAFYMIWQQGTEPTEYADQRLTDQVAEPMPILSERNVSKISDQNRQVVQPEQPFGTVEELSEEQLTPGLSTDLSSVTFSNHTGSIRSIQLHQSDRLN